MICLQSFSKHSFLNIIEVYKVTEHDDVTPLQSKGCIVMDGLSYEFFLWETTIEIVAKEFTIFRVMTLRLSLYLLNTFQTNFTLKNPLF